MTYFIYQVLEDHACRVEEESDLKEMLDNGNLSEGDQVFRAEFMGTVKKRTSERDYIVHKTENNREEVIMIGAVRE